MRFHNSDPRHRGPTRWQAFRWAVLDRLLRRRRPAAPGPAAPTGTPDLELIHSTSAGVRITWLGHSSLLIQDQHQNLLVDPVFAERRIALFYPRYAPPPLSPAQLPRVDAILISHSHPDHLDLRSIDALSREATVICPVGLGRLFTRRQFARVVELAWWESTSSDDSTITLVPARHWSCRSAWDRNRTLWGGYVVELPTASIYYVGDSAWCDVFSEIGVRFPDLTAALVPIGGYEPAWFMSQNHINPEEAGQGFLNSGARTLIPVHWGTFQLTDESLREPIERLEAWWHDHAPADRTLAQLAIGETLCLSKSGDETARRSVASNPDHARSAG